MIVIRAIHPAMIDSRDNALVLPCVHVGELPSLKRPGLFGD